MNITSKFTVTVRCKVYSENSNESYTEDLDLTLNREQAMGILIRFAPSHFAIDDYKICFHYNGSSIDGVILLKDDKKYVIKNLNQFISEVHEGYFRLLALDKFSSILEYDFSNNISEENIEDEFGDQ